MGKCFEVNGIEEAKSLGVGKKNADIIEMKGNWIIEGRSLNDAGRGGGGPRANERPTDLGGRASANLLIVG